MNKKAVIAGFIVLVIGIALALVAEHFLYTFVNSHPNGAGNSVVLYDSYVASYIVGGLLALAGIIVFIYGFILRDPPVHWNNNL